MSGKKSYSPNYTVYPGEYVPPEETEILLQDLNNTSQSTLIPLANMSEFDDHFRIEMLIPGVQRGDIMIRIYKNGFRVSVLPNVNTDMQGRSKIHEFENHRMERHIRLSKIADLEFTRAEYKEGVLSLYVPKTKIHSKLNTDKIVVY